MVFLIAGKMNDLVDKHKISYRLQKRLKDMLEDTHEPGDILPAWLKIEGVQSFWEEFRLLWKQKHDRGESSPTSPSTESESAKSPGAASFRETASPDPQVSDPTARPTHLPDDHPLYMLQETLKQTGGKLDNLSFLLVKHARKARLVDIATANGARAKYPTQATLKLKPIGVKHMCWTLDINNVRFIMKAKGGAPQGGSQYHYWVGFGKGIRGEGFEGPLAFSPDSNRLASNHGISGIKSTEDPNIGRSCPPMTYDLRKPKVHGVVAPPGGELSGHRNLEQQITGTAMSPEQEHHACFQSTGASETLLADRYHSNPPSGNHATSHGSLSRQQKSSRELDSPGSFQPHRLTNVAGNPAYASTKRRKTEYYQSEQNRLPEDVSQAYPQQRASAIGHQSLEADARLTGYDQPRIRSESVIHTVRLEDPLPTLSKDKQERTTLNIYLYGVCKKRRFRDCFTPSAFFARISDAQEIPMDSVKEAEVVVKNFEDKEAEPWSLTPSDKEGLEILIDEISNAAETGPCNVSVHITQHHN